MTPLQEFYFRVENRIGPHTVNTMPLKTIEATLDHAFISRTIDRNMDEAREQLARLAEVGIDLDQITTDLQAAGVKAFTDDFHKLLTTVEQRAQVLI